MSMRRLMAGAAGGLAIALGAGHMSTLQAQDASSRSADQRFISYLAAENLFEVRVAQAAQTKASSSSVKEFAQRMVVDHTSMQKQWMALASENDLDFRAALSPQQVEHAERLSNLTGAEFDRAYMGLMVQSHRDNVNAFQNERGVAHSAAVRELIDRDVAALQEHSRLAQQIGSQVGSDMTATTGPGTDTTSVATQPGQATPSVRADSAFIGEVNASIATELRLARMAESRAQDSRVKGFAQNMVTDHTRMQKEWGALSSRNSLRGGASISARHQEQVTRLGKLSGTEFDRAYMAAMVQNRQENVNVFQARGRAAQSPDVRQLVERNLPHLQQQLSLAQQIETQVRTGATTVATENPQPAQNDEDRQNQGRQNDGQRGTQDNFRADAQFIRNVGGIHFLQVRLGRLAQEKARDPAVKRFGKQMEEGHSDLQERWSDMAARGGMKLNSGLGPDRRAHVDRLAKVSGREFDRAYMTFMIQSHNGLLNFWGKEGRAARSAPVRQLINRGIPTLREYMDTSKRIGKQVGVDAEEALAGRRVATERPDRPTVIK